jgi:hypothetical protein
VLVSILFPYNVLERYVRCTSLRGLHRTETPRGFHDPDREMCMIDRLLLRSSDRLAITGICVDKRGFLVSG